MSHGFPTRSPLRLLALGCSAIALAAALAAPVAAQSYQGSATVVFGNANVTAGPGTTDVNIGSASAVIDWTPTDTALANGQQINWQSGGTTAFFTGTNGNFAVLNRVVPADTSRPIAFNGTTISQVLNGQFQTRGGTVFFYSPGGIVVGTTGVFDVGSLGLTTAPPVVDTSGNWYVNNTVQFGQAATQSSVLINPGAQINATPRGSYVAAFAPYVQHDGTITANGRAALIAGEAGTVTFSPDGLFDIQVSVGTGRTGTVQRISGDIAGSASTGAGDNRRIYLVAVPKNQLVTTLIERGASLGFAIAGAADVQGNAVVLTAGYNITDGVAEAARAGGGGTGAIQILDGSFALAGDGIDFTSALSADASDEVLVQINRQSRFSSDAALRGDRQASVGTFQLANTPAGSLTVGGNLTVSATRPAGQAGSDDAGFALLNISAGTSIAVAGDLTLSARASRDADGDGVVTAGPVHFRALPGSTVSVGRDLLLYADALSDGLAGAPDAQGSMNVQLNAEAGSAVNVGRVTRVNSNGIAGLNAGDGGQGADGRGGAISVKVTGGAGFSTRELNVTADGVGGADVGSGSGRGTGGSALIQVSGANSVLTVQVPNVTGDGALGDYDMLSAEGYGGGTMLAGGVGGLAQGGSASIWVTDGARLALPTQADAFGRIFARAYGGNASGNDSTGGEARAGAVAITVDAATLTGEALTPSSFAQGGGDRQQSATGVVNGGHALGGTRTLNFTNGAVFTGSITGGGPSGVGGSGSATGRGGDGSGGIATTTISGSTLNVSARGFLTFTQNSGGGGLIGGNASEGVAVAVIDNGSVINLTDGARLGVTASAFANGTLGGIVTATGGTASAGAASLFVNGATIQGNGEIEVAATGFGGSGPVAGGAGRGGTASLLLVGSTVDVAGLKVNADGEGSRSDPQQAPATGASGGAGIGGQASVSFDNATVTAPTIALTANGKGGSANAPGATGLRGGTAAGGLALLQANSGTNAITASTIRVNAVGEGGGIEAGSGSGGDATGGTALLHVFQGITRIATASLILGADGSGGKAGGLFGDTANNGGNGTGGSGQLTVAADGTLEIAGGLEVSGEGRGGAATAIDPDTGAEFGVGNGGEAIGGKAHLSAIGGELKIAGNIAFDGQDEGGAGLTGGSATAGESTINADGGTIALSGTVSVGRSALGGRGELVGGNALGSLADNETDSLIIAQNGGAISIDGLAKIETTTTGGAAFAGGRGGAATGGRAQSYALAGGSIVYDGNLTVETRAVGGEGAIGGAARAGVAYLQSGPGGTTTVNGDATVRANADAPGYRGGSATGGAATGGAARIYATDGNARMTISGNATLAADASGGTGARDAQGNGGPGGAAVAGSAGIVASANTANVISIGEAVRIGATAFGGTGRSVSGGNATGGLDFIIAGDASSITIGGGASLIADAYAGSVETLAGLAAPAGTRGGDAFGGQAMLRLHGSGGAVSVGGELYLSPFAYGGDANNSVGDGGDATMGLSQISAQNGTVSLGSLDADPIAAGGSGDRGGNALAGANTFAATVVARNAAITIAGSTSLVVDAAGGNGRAGGTGGSALAVGVVIDADSSPEGGSTIALADVNVISNARGGRGGDGDLATPGGGGGDAASGPVQIFGTAGNGTLIITGTIQANSFAAGGDGGQSGTGIGGAGGEGRTGRIEVGTKSGEDVGAVNAGSARFADVFVDSSAAGGAGGASDSGTGGAGGNAVSGGAALLVSGSPVIANSALLSAAGSGGDGGSGATRGVGGFGAAGGASLIASQRFQRTERGSATLGTLTLASSGIGGDGVTPGASYFADGGGVSLIQSEVTVGSLSYSNLGGLPPPPAIVDPVEPIKLTLSDATFDVGTLSMTTPGEFLLDLARSRVAAGTFAIAAGSFVLPALAPAQPGTITVRDSLSLSSGPGGSIRTYANFVSLGDAFYSSGQDVVLGDVENEGLFEVEAAGIITVGNLSAQGASLSAGGDIQAGNVRTGPLFVARSSGGSVSAGTIDASQVTLEAATNISAQRITASSILGRAGAAMAVMGSWNAPAISLQAAEIAIPDGGALTAGADGSVNILTTNGAGAFIGDGLPGQGGFRLTNAEFGRISGNQVLIGVLDSPANAVDMTIGSLAISAAQLPGTNASVQFATGDADFQTVGRIRVNGAITGSGFSADQTVDFTTDSFEIDAQTGSVALGGSGLNGLGGLIKIDAATIHVASPAILAKLRENPRYAGVAEELNAPAAVQRPEGVLRALGLVLYPEDTLYIQNTGTAANPAGFYTTIEHTDTQVPGDVDPTAPDVDIVINGRFAAEGGDVAGRAVHGAVLDSSEGFRGIAKLSQINGCAISATSCAPATADSPELAVLQSEIALLNGLALEEAPFDLGEGSSEEEEEAERTARAPIESPAVLINTRPLNPPVDIADPVSGSGNPASLAEPTDTSAPGDPQ